MSNFNSNNFIQTTLGELVSQEKKSIISGPFGSNIGKIFFKTEGIPVIRGNNLSTGGEKFKDQGFVFITRKKADELNCYAIKNDLIFTAVGTIGQVGIIDEKLKYDEYIISNKQLRVRFDNNKITPLFAYYWFSSYWIQKLILQRNVGSTVPLINLSVLKGLPITLPKSINVQNKIVEVLENISLKIELNNRINTELEAMAKTLYDYWFVQFDFPTPSPLGRAGEGIPYKTSGGKMVWNEELKREIPEGWEAGTIGNYCKSTGGFAFKSSWWSDKGLKVVKIKDIQENNTINLTDLSFADIPIDKIGINFLAKPGNVLIAMTGATVGKFAIVPFTAEPLFVNQRVGYFNLGDNPIEKLPFLINSLNQKYFREAIFTLASGAAQPNISNEQINDIQLLSPKKDLIEKFNAIFSSYYLKILSNQKENQELASLRDWLLPMLMNGQVNVVDVAVLRQTQDDMLGMVAEASARYEK